jgi:16S rRNA (guanine966-N2)-methyltransferase
VLQHGIEGLEIEGARALDLFAGTGALGLEALSRGARYCFLIEQNASARGLLRRNVEDLQLTGITRIWRRDATKLGPAGNLEPSDLMFLDPPYGKGLGEKALSAAHEGRWIKPGAIAVLEERTGVEVAIPTGYEQLDVREYGETQVMFLRAV